MFMLAFISWNENNNGFDLVGLDFFFSEYRRVAFYFIQASSSTSEIKSNENQRENTVEKICRP